MQQKSGAKRNEKRKKNLLIDRKQKSSLNGKYEEKNELTRIKW
jgi:hypothetical protein